MSSNDFLNNDNKTNLLFNQFQKVVYTQMETDTEDSQTFRLEKYKALTNIYQQDIFSQNIPIDLSSTLAEIFLGVSPYVSVSDSSWNTNVQDQTIGYVDISNIANNTSLQYYNRVYLQPVGTTSQAWWLIDASAYATGKFGSNDNILKNMIPFKYNDIDPATYTPIVEYWDSTTNSWQQDNQANPDKLNWVIDYPTGILLFFQNEGTLSTLNINESLGDSVEKSRPRISFIKYNGPTGFTSSSSGTGGSGLINVGEITNNIIGNTLDVSAIYFDTNGFDLSLNNSTAIVVNKGGSGGSSVSDVSYLFFDIPLAPTDPSGYLDQNLGSGTIVLKWNNPSQQPAALPFGKYVSYPIGSTSESLIDITNLPFLRHMNIEYLEYTGGIANLDPRNNNNWSTLEINNVGQTVLPNTLTEAYFTSNLGSIVDLCSNTGVAPFNRVYTDKLELGKGYQFRIYLDNSGSSTPGGFPITDPIYKSDVSWNYLYIPDVSGEYIELGLFGSAVQPTNLEFQTETYKSFNVNLSTTNTADSSLNTTFPISSNLSLTYKFGVTVSGEIDPGSIQTSEHRLNQVFDVDISSSFQKENNVTFNYNSIGSGVDYSLLSKGILAAPEFNYRLKEYYGVNSQFPNDFSYSLVEDNTKLPIPTRDEAITNEAYKKSMKNISFGFPVPSNVTNSSAIPATSSSSISNIWFMDEATTTSANIGVNIQMNNNPGTNGDGVTGGIIGTQTTDISLSYLKVNINSSIVNIEADSSNNPTTGYLDISTSEINTFFFDLSANAEEAGTTPAFQNQGFYTGLNITSLSIKNLNLTNFPDICNNSYNSYNYQVTQYYNDVSNGNPPNWNPSTGNTTTTFRTAKKPLLDVSYQEIGYNDSTTSLTNSFFGLKRPNPSSNINIDFSYNLYNINADWKPSTTIATNNLKYVTYVPNVTTTDNESWPSDRSLSTDVIPFTSIPIIFLKNTKQYSREDSSLALTHPQFWIDIDYNNNVLRTPTSYDTSRNILFETNEILWWDFTYDTNPTGTTAKTIDNVSGFSTIESLTYAGGPLLGGSTWPTDTSSSPGGFFTVYNHTIEPSYNEMIWANGGFRPANTQPPTDSPYIDYTSFYNPGSVLKDYSILANQGDQVSYTIGNGEYWGPTSSDRIGSVDVSGNYKWVTFKMTSNVEDKFLTINVYSGTTLLERGSLTKGGDYLLYILETNAGFTTSSGYAYNGRSGWLDTQVLKDPGDSLTTQALDGNGCYNIVNNTNKISLVLASQGNASNVYIKIGLHKDSTNKISSVTYSTSSS